MTKYRVAIGLDLGTWNNNHEDRMLGSILTEKEASTWKRTRATAIFYTERPTSFMTDLIEDGFEMEDFNWINISKE